MRLLLMMASILIISSLIFNGYSNGMGDGDDFSSQLTTPIEKAENVNQLIVDASMQQQQAIAKQIQQ
jgi:hypothetical protein